MRRLVLMLLTGLTLTGCAASVQKSPHAAPIRVAANGTKLIVLNVTGAKKATDAADWEQFKGEWRAAMKAQAAAIGVVFASQEGEAKPTGEAGTLVVVQIADYRYVSPGARYGFGVMTGNAFINATVYFRDLSTGTDLGDRAYDTSSTAWQGVFSAMTEKQVQAICKEIVDEMTGR